MDGSTHSGLLAMHAQSNMSDLTVKLTVYRLLLLTLSLPQMYYGCGAFVFDFTVGLISRRMLDRLIPAHQ